MAQPADLSVAQAMQFIRQSGDRLVAILDGPAEPAVKRQQLAALINDTIDVDGIARFALGPYWRTASDGQRSEYVRLFPAVLLGNIGRTFGGYQGVRFSIDRGTQVGDAIQVTTTVYRPDNTLQQVVWVVSAIGGAAKIIDIVAAGVSMRIAQRNGCVNLLVRDNDSVQALIETLRRQAAAVS